MISILAVAIIVLLGSNTVQAESYKIEDMDIQATVMEDGSVQVKQEITYDFKGHYNGVFVNIPYYLEDSERKEVVTNGLLEDSFNNASNVRVLGVSLIENQAETKFKQAQQARNGNAEVFTNTKQAGGIQQIKAYMPSTNEARRFKVEYVLENLCVRHSDVGELYYNFIGGAWEVGIQKLNIDIYLPNNQTPIEVWGHGPY